MRTGTDDIALAEMATGIAAGRFGAAADLFRSHGIDAPLIRWNPAVTDLPVPQLAFLLGYWQSLLDGDGRVAPERIDPLQMRPALGHIMLLDVIDGGTDYRYRLYGSEIAARAGFDMTGRRTSELPTGNLASRFFTAVYRAVLQRPEPVYTWHQMPVDITVNTWHRLVLPLHDADGGIPRLLAGNVGMDIRRGG